MISSVILQIFALSFFLSSLPHIFLLAFDSPFFLLSTRTSIELLREHEKKVTREEREEDGENKK